MDRKATLATMLGRGHGQSQPAGQSAKANATVTTLNTGLEPFTGEWTFEKAAHLLRRSTFGPTLDQIKKATVYGLDATVKHLFAGLPHPAPPLNFYETEDPHVAIGETWINAAYNDQKNVKPYRWRSFRAWLMTNILEEDISIREKLTLFWHNHFAVSKNIVNEPRFIYRYFKLLRTNAWGNFRDLVKDMTIEPAMLRFLNGNQNTKEAPNENYARELLELFTIGKGPLAGPDDYTNYTEVDVQEIARILTGWRDRGFSSRDPETPIEAFYVDSKHDTGNKTLSHRFNNKVITNGAEGEYIELINIIFEQKEVARFISRKLYRWFIYYKIDENAEVNVIEPMAELLIENDYEIRPALQALLRSEHFFDILSVGPMIKNPLDFTISPLKQMQVSFPKEDAFRYYKIMLKFYGLVDLMEMDYINPPEVAGWKAYYQEPQFYRTWINATTLQQRMGYTNKMINSGYTTEGVKTRIDSLQVIKMVENAEDPNEVVNTFATIWFPQAITDSQKAALKDILIPGLPDFEWTVEYGEYAANPENEDLKDAIESKLQDLIQAMMSMAEYYLS